MIRLAMATAAILVILVVLVAIDHMDETSFRTAIWTSVGLVFAAISVRCFGYRGDLRFA